MIRPDCYNSRCSPELRAFGSFGHQVRRLLDGLLLFGRGVILWQELAAIPEETGTVSTKYEAYGPYTLSGLYNGIW